MPEGISLENIIEAPTKAHPELHGPYPERVDDAITKLVRHSEAFTDYSPSELETWHREFALVEHEHLQPHAVTIRSMKTVAELLAQRAEESSDVRMQAVARKLTNIVNLLTNAVGEYANSVRHSSEASEVLHLNENGETRLRHANLLRTQAHEHIVDALETHRLAMQVEVPEALDVSVMSKTEWQKLSTSAYMEKRNITLKGARREQIGAWALDMDIAIKAGSMRELLTTEIEKRKTDVA